MQTLVLYDSSSSYTGAVYDHLNGFCRYGLGDVYFCDCNIFVNFMPFEYFQSVVIHYSVRVAHNNVPRELTYILRGYKGTKVLFLQDEYENTNTSKRFILDAAVDFVYTCVPTKFIQDIYGDPALKSVKFINTLTGYVVENESVEAIKKIDQRPIQIGFRGRALPYWYGDLGQEKLKIAQTVRKHCEDFGIVSNIEWDDDKRIYGKAWGKFLGDCQVVLGVESGCNLFDFDGNYKKAWLAYMESYPDATYLQSRQAILGDFEEKPLMNQISPRVFEAIANKTALLMFKGEYSGILKKDWHYISLEKDFSNLEECLERVKDKAYLQRMVDRAFDDIISSNKYHERGFFRDFYKVLEKANRNVTNVPKKGLLWCLFGFTTAPIVSFGPAYVTRFRVVWRLLPEFLKRRIRPAVHFLLYWLSLIQSR